MALRMGGLTVLARNWMGVSMRVAQLLFLMCMCFAAAALPAADAFRVRGDTASLYAAPGASGGEVCTVGGGTLLRSTGRTAGEWVQVEIPDDSRLYVYSRLVSGGVVMATRLRVRSGPGIAFPAVGEVEKGGKLSIISSEGDWLAISAPPGCLGWVKQHHRGEQAEAPERPRPVVVAPQVVTPEPVPVEDPPVAPVAKPVVVARDSEATPIPAPKPKPREVATPVVAPVTVSRVAVSKPPIPVVSPPPVVRPVVAPRTVDPPPVKQLPVKDVWADLHVTAGSLPGIKGSANGRAIQGVVERSGHVRPSLRGRYRLVSRDSGYPQTVCWLPRGTDPSLLGRTVEARGMLVHRQGTRLPWLKVESIRAVSR